MIKLTSKKEDILDYVTKTWRRAANHSSYIKWRQECISSTGLYNGGLQQWNPLDLKALEDNKEVPITVNVVAGFVDTLCGVETQSRYRTIARVDERGQESRDLGRALTQFLLNWQEHEDIVYLDAIKFKDALVGGIAWSAVYGENSALKYERVESLEMIFDANDITPQFTNSELLGRMHWMRPDDINMRWKDKVSKLNLDDYKADQSYMCGSLANLSSPVVPLYNTDSIRGKRLVCELQYKVPSLAYQGIAQNGRWFSTFDLEVAEKVVSKPSDIEEFPSKRILRTIFFQDIVLNHSFLNPSYPDQDEYSYIPFVWKRRNSDGVPYSFIEPMRGLQMELNARFTKAVNCINANKVFLFSQLGTNGTLPGYKTPADVKKHIFQKNSVTVLSREDRVQFESGIVLGEEQVKIVELTIEMMKRVCGIYDDMRGGNSAQTSGVAEQIRVSNSLRTNAFIFDHFSMMKKRVCTQAIKLFQSMAGENIYINGVDDKFTPVFVNLIKEKMDGSVEILNDINFLPFTLYLEEVPNFRSSLNQRKEELLAVLNNPHANILLMTPEFLDLFMDNGEEVAAGFAKAQQAMAQIQAGAKAQEQGQLPPPTESIPTPETIGVQ